MISQYGKHAFFCLYFTKQGADSAKSLIILKNMIIYINNISAYNYQICLLYTSDAADE